MESGIFSGIDSQRSHDENAPLAVDRRALGRRRRLVRRPGRGRRARSRRGTRSSSGRGSSGGACARCAPDPRRSVLRHLPQRTRLKTGGLALDGLDRRAPARARRGLGEGRPQAAAGRDAAARASRRPDPQALRRVRRLRSRTSSIATPRAHPEPGPADAPPPEPRRVRATRSAICWRSTWMRPRCCRPTTPPSASTTSPTCSACRRRCRSAISRRRQRISALAVGDHVASVPAATPTACAQDLSQNQHVEGLPLGTVGGTARAPHRSRSTASTTSRPSSIAPTSTWSAACEYPERRRSRDRRQAGAPRDDRRQRRPGGSCSRSRPTRATRSKRGCGCGCRCRPGRTR